MPHDEVTQLKKQMETYHKEVMNEIKSLNEKVDPVCKVYASAQGFGKVSVWIAKWIVMPVIAIGGGVLTFKNIIK